MARWYVLQGPHGTREEAEEAHAALNKNHTRLRVARLRDRTGPSVAERLTAERDAALARAEKAERQSTICLVCADAHADKLRDRTGPSVVAERLAALESDLLDLRTRVGDLEREPVASPPAPTEPDPTPEQTADPDRLAKVVFDAACHANGSASLGWTWEKAREDTRSIYRAIAAAVAEANGLQNDVLAKAVDDLTAECAALLARAEKAEREVKQCTQDRFANGEALAPFMETGAAPFVATDAQAIASLVADWQKRGEEIAALKAAQPTPARDPLTDPRPGLYLLHEDGTIIAVRDLQPAQPERAVFDLLNKDRAPLRATPLTAAEFAERFDGHARPMTAAEVAAFKRDGTWPSAQLTEEQMAAELREAGWEPSPIRGMWCADHRCIATSDAHAAMRAAKGAK